MSAGYIRISSFQLRLPLLVAVVILAVWGGACPITPAAAMEPVDSPPIAWTEVDRELAAALSTARLRAFGKAQVRFSQLMTAVSGRVEHDFIPWYASFGRRKIEELQAYNHFATDKARQFLTGEARDSGTPVLVATFESEFSRRVLKPDEMREAIRVLARDIMADYSSTINEEVRQIQRKHGIPFELWMQHLGAAPTLAYVGEDGRSVEVPIGNLVDPGPVWGELALVTERRLTDRFERLPSIVDHGKLVVSDGTSIFAVGQNVAVYFSTYIIYWIVLFFLVQSGLIPISFSGALIGWIVWEIFAWGSWIGYEALGFEETRAALTTTIQFHADAFFAQARTFIGDFSDSGPFRALYQVERSLSRP